MEHIVQVVKEALPNLRVTLLEPSPFDDVTQAPQPRRDTTPSWFGTASFCGNWRGALRCRWST
jgi:hypothetical protein